jgi:hypothetical protein
MNTKIFRAIFFVALGLICAKFVLPLSPVSAQGPGQGLPLSGSWPSAQPLQVGVPSTAGTFSPLSSPSFTQLPVGVISSPPGVPQNVPAGAIYVTPVPPPNASPQTVTNANAPQIQAPTVNYGNTRNDALTPDGSWQTLGSGGVVWYLIGTGGPHIDVKLTTEPHSGVLLDIFAPNQSDVPIGRGTATKSDPPTLIWSGGSWRTNGNWYARITNSYYAPIRYQLVSTATPMGKKDCYSYWEYIGPSLVYWTECNR